jgi:[acyl-carrier-protein] S-malonyltransferase
MSTPAPQPPRRTLPEAIGETALAFRGYNVTNLGRTPELITIDAYRPILDEELARYSAICAAEIRLPVNLAQAVERRHEFGIDQYAQAVALVVATEVAQLRLLREVHKIDYAHARLAFGYSLGEMIAVCCGGAISPEDLVRIPLALARDCADLAHDVTLAIVFSRGKAIPEDKVRRLCGQITAEGRGTIGISAVLSPNTYLVVGQGDTVARYKAAMKDALPQGVQLRPNDQRWPPLHTPIVRQRHIPDRTAVLVESLPVRTFPVRPAVVSLVTGKRSYDEYTARDILHDWVDHPQRLWDAVCETLAADCKTVLHVGPEPNVIPATFERLAVDVRQQIDGKSAASYGKRAIAGIARHPWLSAVLPVRATILRATQVEQIVLEDWLVEHAPT